ncbi:hypothetical protein FACS1894137_15160 [Spirochaetia bacterium]|nr:hypothetical protein FACS1894137_15160 [Spirochaetia bacterium]
MTIEQTVDIPADRRLMFDVPQDVPVGRCRIVFFPEPSVPAKADPEEPLPRVTRAQREEWEKDPVIQELNKPLKLDWSWLPEGLTPETLTHKDLREMRLRDKYGL